MIDLAVTTASYLQLAAIDALQVAAKVIKCNDVVICFGIGGSIACQPAITADHIGG